MKTGGMDGWEGINLLQLNDMVIGKAWDDGGRLEVLARVIILLVEWCLWV